MHSEISGWENDELKVRLAVCFHKRRVNVELMRFLASYLEIRKFYVQLIHGETSRHKRVLIKGQPLIDLKAKI